MKKIIYLQFLFLLIVSQGLAQTKIPFINSYTQESIKAIPKGQRPEPSVYLDKIYIKKHLKAFKNGASFITSKDALDKYGRKMLGRPDGQFVMSKKQMTKLLKKAKGRLDFIEKQLGIPKGLWKDKTLVRIDIPEPQKLNLRIPNGNEGGANDLWLPGGKLPTNYSEAVVNQIPEGSYTETVIVLK